MINFSNHPSALWSAEQLKAAEVYGEVVDIAFPVIPANADSHEIARLADKYVVLLSEKAPDAVLVQGEMSFTFFDRSYCLIKYAEYSLPSEYRENKALMKK